MIKPSWVTTYPNDQVTYGFDSRGMWFMGDSNGVSYPVRSNFDIPQNQTTTIIFTFLHDSFCSDQGVCVFPINQTPIWEWETQETRIAFQMNCPSPELDGQENSIMDEGEVLEVGRIYTGKMVYNPLAGTVTGDVYLGSSVSGEPISSLMIEETLPEGPYRVGFDSDSDGYEDENHVRSYFTKISVNQYTSLDGDSACRTICPTTNGFSCRKPDLTCNCTKLTRRSGAYIAAITMCNQRLY